MRTFVVRNYIQADGLKRFFVICRAKQKGCTRRGHILWKSDSEPKVARELAICKLWAWRNYIQAALRLEAVLRRSQSETKRMHPQGAHPFCLELEIGLEPTTC